MNLKEKLNSDFKEAFKAKKEARLSVLKMLQAEIRNSEIAKRTKLGEESPLDDDEVLKVISSEIKKRKKAIELYERGGRADLASKEKKEIEVLSAYLPNL